VGIRIGLVICAVGAMAGCSHATSAPRDGRLSCTLRRPRFHTLPALKPTGFCLAVRRGAPAPTEDLAVTPRPDPRKNPGEQFGLMLLSPDGRLLWYERRPTKVHDLKVVIYHGRPALAFFQQHGRHGYYQLLDEHYRPLRRITAAHGYSTNLHELQLTGDTAWVSADVHVGSVIEYVVQQRDLDSGRVRFEWHSLRHVSPATSYERRPAHGAWDYFHGNSIAAPTAADPTMIVSSRNTSSLYGVDPQTGRTRWILGGKRDQFHLPRRWRFCAQHDVHRLDNGDLMLFDNGGTDMHGTPHCPTHPARAMEFRLDVRRHRVRLIRSMSSRPVSADGRGFFSAFVGSARPLAGGGVAVDWGDTPRVSLFGPGGREDAMLGLQYWSYRAVPVTWDGRPGGTPAVAARRDGDDVDVWASWNGATAVRRWQVLAGPSPDALQPAGAPTAFAGLETEIRVRSNASYLAVQALGAGGTILGRSAAVAP
jgi:hypothetical protein